MNDISEKIAICYTCCGPTYRKSALDKIENTYEDHPNIYYFILTDDKSYFKDVKRQNFIVNELKDFYNEFPYLEKYEAFLESENEEDYATKFIKESYTFPFSTMRFHLKQCEKFNITNVAILCTDSDINFARIDSTFFENKNKIYNAVSVWPKNISENFMTIPVEILRKKGYNVEENIMVFDAAARLFVFESVDKMVEFFNIWNDVIVSIYIEGKMRDFKGGYARNDEYILAPIYNASGITMPDNLDIYVSLFRVKHNSKEERFWAYYGS